MIKDVTDLDVYNFCEILKNKYNYINFIKINRDTTGATETINLGIKEIMKHHNYSLKCLLLDCDTFYTQNIIELFRNINNNAVFYIENFEKNPIYSYIEIDNDNIILNIIEKEKISDYACTGIYCFSDINILLNYTQKVLDNGITFKNEPYISCVISMMIKEKHLFTGIKLNTNNVFNLGTPKQLKNYIDNTYAFLFDLDGTLVNTDNIYYDVWKIILKKFNIDITKDIFEKYIKGNNDMNVFNMLLPNTDINIKNISDIKDKLFLENIEKLTLIKNSYEFLQIVKLLGHKICIVTSCNRTVANKIVELCKFNDFIDFIIVSNECSKPKPFSEPYLCAMKKYNIENNKCFIFEDSKTGILSGKNTNPKCLIGIETSYNKEELVNVGTNISINDYNDINIDSLINFTDITVDKIKTYIKNSIKQFNIKSIIIDDEKLKGGYISDVLNVTLILDNNVEKHCVIKIENNNVTGLSTMAKNLDLYGREYYFYENISKYIDINVPEFYGLVKDNNYFNIGILMENLNIRNFELNINLNTTSIDISLKVIESCAKLHSRFWNKNLDKIFPLLKKNNHEIFQKNIVEFTKIKFPIFKNKWTNLLNSKQIDIAEKIILNYSKIQNNMSNNNLTLCHGDIKSPNTFYELLENGTYEPYFIDWQYTIIGKGIQDIVFFMIESFDIEKIKILCPIFKNYYYTKLLEYGINNYTYKEYETDFINSVCYYPFFVAIWFGTVPYDDLIDKNFPFFFIQKLFNFINDNDLFNIKLFNEIIN